MEGYQSHRTVRVLNLLAGYISHIIAGICLVGVGGCHRRSTVVIVETGSPWSLDIPGFWRFFTPEGVRWS